MDLNDSDTSLQRPATVVRLDTAAIARLEPFARSAERAQADAEHALFLARLADEAMTRELSALTDESVDLYTLDLEKHLLLLWAVPGALLQQPASPNVAAADPLPFTPRRSSKTKA